MLFGTFGSLVLLGLFAWSCIWSHLAFKRWESREDAKVRALQQIAASTRVQTGVKSTPEMEISANW